MTGSRSTSDRTVQPVRDFLTIMATALAGTWMTLEGYTPYLTVLTGVVVVVLIGMLLVDYAAKTIAMHITAMAVELHRRENDSGQ